MTRPTGAEGAEVPIKGPEIRTHGIEMKQNPIVNIYLLPPPISLGKSSWQSSWHPWISSWKGLKFGSNAHKCADFSNFENLNSIHLQVTTKPPTHQGWRYRMQVIDEQKIYLKEHLIQLRMYVFKK